MFWDFFAAGLCFPLDPAFPKILARFGLRMHHLTPNAIVQLSKFFLAVKTFEGPVNVDAFCRLYEMHPQTRKVSFDEDPQVFSAQSGCCSFHRGGLIGLKELTKWSCPTTRKTSGRMTGSNTSFMPR